MIPVLPLAPHYAPCPIPLLVTRDSPGVRLDREARAGRLVSVRPGVYAPAGAWNRLAPWDRYLARVHAVAMIQPDAVFAFESAAALLGLPIFGEPAAVHVLSATSTSREIAGVRTHTTVDARSIVDIGGLLVTAPAEVAVDAARSRHPAVALAVADAVLRMDPLATVEQLVACNEARASSRGRRRARWALHRADARSQTPLESVSRAVIEWLGFPRPELQAVIPTAQGEYQLDMYWPRVRVGAEADGRIKYDGRYGDPAEVVWQEKQREDELRRSLDHLARWSWNECLEPMTLRRILGAAGLHPIGAMRTDELFSLRAALHSGHPR
ncbi:hypothetical protein ACTU3I_15365 [Microbacterium sp. RD1]|uniref:hypothetical protein n=1 Tax=Microbacterium sp. RD1 TaxID=3457313 RepID=UPI003FA5FD04